MTHAGPTIGDLVRRLGERRPGSPFLTVGQRSLDGPGFAAAVRGATARLRALGFRPGDRLALHLHRCLDEAIGLCAAGLLGGIAVPINPKLKDDQVAHVLADSAPWGVVTSATKAAALRDPAGVLRGQRLLFGSDEGPRGLPGEALLGPDPGVGAMPEPPDPDAPAVILYTSGSTGLAKGIVQPHRNLHLGAAIVAGYLGLTPDDHLLAVLPFSFDYGLNQLLAAMHSGARVTAADHLGAAELGGLLARVRPTGLAGVPSLWHELCRGLEAGSVPAAAGASLRWITNSGGRLPEADVRALRAALPRARLFSMYGLTEAFRSAFLPPERIDQHPGSFGTALPGVELLLVDPASGAVLEGPATGELVHCGALVAHGYWRNPAATELRFRPDPRGRPGRVVYSGDLVRRDAEGLHHFVARLDRMLKVAGHRVSPDEVAQAVAGLPGTGELAVFGRPGGADGHRIVLVAQGDPADAELPARIRRRCRAALPAYMVPAEVHVRPALPHNQNGKVDVPALERMIPECTDGG